MNRWIRKNKQTLAVIVAVLLVIFLAIGPILMFFA